MSSTAVELYQRPQTAVEIRAQVNLIQEVMKAVMKEGTHFGVIPGCKKPSLWKPGSETLLSTFRIAIEPIVEDLSTPDEARYRVITRATSGNGTFLGAGVGEASSNEDKYKWREAICEQEFEAFPEDRKRMKFKKGQGGRAFTVLQVRTDKADVANTVLKMAKKRSQIDVTLTVTAASDIFTQDVEDIPEELRTEGMVDDGQSAPAPLPTEIKKKEAGPQPVPPPQPVRQEPVQQVAPQTGKPIQSPKQPTKPVISEPQRRRFYAIWKGAGLSEQDVKQYLRETIGTEDDHMIPRDQYEDICAWAETA